MIIEHKKISEKVKTIMLEDVSFSSLQNSQIHLKPIFFSVT